MNYRLTAHCSLYKFLPGPITELIHQVLLTSFHQILDPIVNIILVHISLRNDVHHHLLVLIKMEGGWRVSLTPMSVPIPGISQDFKVKETLSFEVGVCLGCLQVH